MIARYPKFLGLVFAVIFTVAALAQGTTGENSKVIKKVPTTHKVVSL